MRRLTTWLGLDYTAWSRLVLVPLALPWLVFAARLPRARQGVAAATG